MKKITIIITLCCLFISGISQEIQVSFPSDGLQLEGTLSLPTGSGPHPIIILIHGSGPNDRDQTLELSGGNAMCLYPNLVGDTIRNFKEIALFLMNKGYAVLRYDKRTFSHAAQLNAKLISPYDFITDIHSAVDYVKTRMDIDTNCISLIGHSQGANFIPIVANQRNDIKTIIGIGTPVSRIDTLIAMQYRYIYYRCLNDTASGDAFYSNTLNDFQSIYDGTWNPNTTYLGAYPKFWKDWMDLSENMIADYNMVNEPTMILHLEEDLNVPYNDYVRMQDEVNGIHISYRLVSQVNHYMTNDVNPEVDSRVLNEIHGFLEASSCAITHVDSPSRSNTINFQQVGKTLFLSESEWYDKDKVEIYSMSGVLVYENQMNNVQQKGISVEGLSTGCYIFTWGQNSQRQFQKLFIR